MNYLILLLYISTRDIINLFVNDFDISRRFKQFYLDLCSLLQYENLMNFKFNILITSEIQTSIIILENDNVSFSTRIAQRKFHALLLFNAKNYKRHFSQIYNKGYLKQSCCYFKCQFLTIS